jgi:hypothetical protein
MPRKPAVTTRPRRPARATTVPPHAAKNAMRSDRAAATRRLQSLAGPHKWFLGGGRRILWAPEFPLFLDLPGFWDHGTYLELKLDGLFTYTLLEDGAPLPWTCRGRVWRPDVLLSEFAAPGLDVQEEKAVTPDDRFTSTLTLTNTTAAARTVDLILWGRVLATDVGDTRFEAVTADRRHIRGAYRVVDGQHVQHDLDFTWTLAAQGGAPTCTSFAVQSSETTPDIPDWHVTPFYELFNSALPNTCHTAGGIDGRPGGQPHRKWVFVGLHRRLKLAPRRSTTVTGALQIAPRATAGFAAPVLPDWSGFFAQAPDFRCSDPYLEKYFNYRWYGLRLNAIDHGRAPLRHPCVFEGINAGWFRHNISYSSQVLAKDTRWLHDPALAQGCILNFLESQRDDGFIFGGLWPEKQPGTWNPTLMYHSDWGGAVQDVYAIHPDRGFLKACYEPLTRYAEWFSRQRDPEGTHLYDVVNQAETGQEYMSRYLFVDPRGDEWGALRLKGVDATVYVYKLQRALAWMAAELGHADQAAHWHHFADCTADAVRNSMWDPRWHKFCDVDPRNGRRSPVKALTDFYPFLTDLATTQHLPAIHEHLLNPQEFWTEWPAPATALDDDLADAWGRWKGKRMSCTWNGRTWLMTNAHIADVLGQAALNLDPQLEPYAATFLTRFIYMLFVDRDLARPTSYEYYNPLTGQAPFFRGTEDYMHSYIIDLLLRYVVGLRPQPDGGLVVEPLQFGLAHFALDNCVIAGQPVSVCWDGQRLSARVGATRQHTLGWGRLEFPA